MIDLKEYGYIETETPGEGLLPGRVVEVRRELYKTVCPHGEVAAVLTGSFYHNAQAREDFPAVGDFVLLKHNPHGDSGIARMLPRKSKFSRTDFSGHKAEYVKTILEQVVAANFDYVFIMTSLNQDFKLNRVLRYLTAARQSGGQPVVVLTKADLTDDYSPLLSAVEAAAPGVPVHAVSSQTGLGMDDLGRYMQPGKTAVFLGMSGVGKSSLLNALAGETLMHVSDIREDDSRGRHTTTHRQLFRLPSGALIIDTPGMRELGLWNAGEAVGAAFSEVEELIDGCRFSDCRHKTEPGCAVRAALDDGSLSPKQWESYLAQARETAFVGQKSKLKGKA